MIEDEILRILMGTDRPLRTGEIAERLGVRVSKPTVISHLNQLKRQGKVEQVLYGNVPSWQSSREWGNVLQRAERLKQRLKEMYGDKRFSPAEARERLKAEFRREEFDFLLEMIQHIKPPVYELKVTRRIGCTPVEGAEAKRESDASQLAAGVFTTVKQKAQSRWRIAARARQLQRRKEKLMNNLFPEKTAEPVVEEDLAVRAERLPRNLTTEEIKAEFNRSIDSLRHRRSIEEMRRELETKMERLRREN